MEHENGEVVHTIWYVGPYIHFKEQKYNEPIKINRTHCVHFPDML